jgi:fructan beta-fructosidase
MKTMRAGVLAASLIVVLGGVSDTDPSTEAATRSRTTARKIEGGYDEAYRGQFHFSPAQNWMNDPSGLVYYQGEWHLFYQYHPDGDAWGPMHWGHAVSTDLVHWQNLPISLSPDDKGYIYSGSAVVDGNNTSGLFPSGTGGLVAVFTYHSQDGQESQAIAYSTDRGRTWSKYAGNPVIPNPGVKDFRDPKVFWYAPQQKWLMVLGGDVRIYSSKNLREWTQESTLDGVSTEMPDLFELPAGDRSRWVLSLGGPRYLVGDFDGHRFTPTQEVKTTDFGRDFYAAQSWNNAPDGRRYWIGWMDNWSYAERTPTAPPWRGQQTEPRTVTLAPDPQRPGEFVLAQQPAPQLGLLAGKPFVLSNKPIPTDRNLLQDQRGTSYEIRATLDVGTASEVGFTVREGAGQHTRIGYDAGQQSLALDRRQSGDVGFSSDFPANTSAPLALPRNRRLTVRILVDRSSVEVFAQNGTVVFTDRIYPDLASDGMSMYARGGRARVVSMTVTPLRPMWTMEGIDQ